MAKKLRKALLLTALMLFGATSVSAATKNQVQVKTGDAFYETVADMYENDANTGSVLSDDGVTTFSRLIVITDKTFTSFNYAGVVSAVTDGTGAYIVQFDTMANAEKAYAALSKDPAVTVEYDVMVDWLDAVDDETDDENVTFESESIDATATHYTWGAATMATDSYATFLKKTSHSQLIVAVVDSGITKSHPMFSGRLVSGYDFVDGDSDPADGKGHGTHVAGTIADITKELSFIKIMPVRVLNNSGGGSGTAVGNGIKYAADKGAKVINLSLGSADACITYVDTCVKYAIDKGATVVVAAGNENHNIESYHVCPAHIKDCITVAAINSNKVKASFSNFGEAVDTAAPGVDVKSAWLNNSYNTISGTSMATPHVAAVVAMMRAQYGTLSSSKMHTLIKRASKRIGTEQWDKYFGYGLINMSNLMKDVSTLDIKLSATSFKYTGSAIKPSLTVKRNGASLYADKDYALSYSNNTKVGKASVKITGKGSYTGSVTKTFTIRPKGTSISGVTINVGGFKAKWKTVTEECSGYELQMSRYSDMSEAKIFDVPGKTIGYKSVKNLKAGKKYYIRVRAYKTVSGTKYYSSWSAITYAVPK